MFSNHKLEVNTGKRKIYKHLEITYFQIIQGSKGNSKE